VDKIASPKETALSLILLGELNNFLKNKKVMESSAEGQLLSEFTDRIIHHLNESDSIQVTNRQVDVH